VPFLVPVSVAPLTSIITALDELVSLGAFPLNV